MILWAHQQRELDESWNLPVRARFWQPRTGKTLVCLEEMARLFRYCGIGRFLVVAPKLAALETWPKEHYQSSFSKSIALINLAKGSLNSRVKLLREIDDCIVVVNYEVLKELRKELAKWAPEYIVYDESHYLKSVSSQRSRAAYNLSRLAKYKRILTGNPNPRNYIDLYSQYKILDPTIFGTRKNDFMDYFVSSHPIYRSTVLGYKNVEELRKKLFSIASRVKLEDCFDMPDVVRQTVEIEMTKEQRNQHDHWGVELHRLVSQLRRQQFIAQLKAERIGEIVADWILNDQKIVIFARFQEEVDLIAQRLLKEYPSVPVYTLDGRTPPSKRDTALQVFSSSEASGVACLVVNIAIATGISLAGANTAIISSVDYDYSHYEQSLARIWKPGGKLTYIYVKVKDSMDQPTFSNLKRKQVASEKLLDKNDYIR